MAYTGGLGSAFNARRRPATDFALKAAAQVVANGLKDPKPAGLRGGYTSGDFVTGNLLNSIFLTDVVESDGGWSIAVATDVMYAVYWEYGHYNIFLRRFIREERWRPTLMRTEEAAVAAYRRVYARTMGA